MIGRLYNHDPRHYRFTRSTQEFAPIEEHSEGRGGRWWLLAGLVTLALAVWLLS